jgi:phosphopantothenoylcysteine decarboxylase
MTMVRSVGGSSVVVCAAPPASDAHELVKLAQAAGWEVCVTATPEAMHWIDPAMLTELPGYELRSDYRSAGEAKSLPEADAI